MKNCSLTPLKSVANGFIFALGFYGLCVPVFGAAASASNSLVIECRGTVKPRQELTLQVRPGERVLSVRPAPGDLVQTGQTLIEVFDGEAWARLLELKKARLEPVVLRAELQSKTERLNRLNVEYSAQLKLWKEVDPDSAERRIAALREKRDELEEQVALLRLRAAVPEEKGAGQELLSDTLGEQIQGLEKQLSAPFVRAPFAGRIIFLAPNVLRLAAGETALVLWGTNLVVQADVLQHQLQHVTAGDRAEVSLDFSESKSIVATVEAIDPKAEIKVGEVYPTYPVILKLGEATPTLRAGMRITVRIHPSAR